MNITTENDALADDSEPAELKVEESEDGVIVQDGTDLSSSQNSPVAKPEASTSPDLKSVEKKDREAEVDVDSSVENSETEVAGQEPGSEVPPVSKEASEDRQPNPSDSSERVSVSARQAVEIRSEKSEGDEPPPDVESSRTSIVQNVNVNYDKEGLQLEFQSIPPHDLECLKEIFVPPRDFTAHRSRFGDSKYRVFVVHGPNLCGKFTTAINIALEARKHLLPENRQEKSEDGESEDGKSQPGVLLYRRQSFDTITLDRAMREVKQPGSVVVVRDAFEKNMHPDSLVDSELKYLQSVLKDEDLDLILTTEADADFLHDVDATKISAAVKDLHTIYEKHLECHSRIALPAEWVTTIRHSWNGVSHQLNSPSHISRFFERILAASKMYTGLTTELLEEMAREVAAFGRVSTRAWFTDLPSNNERLFALLVGLFEGIDLELLTEIYSIAVRFFREDGFEDLKDSRSFGLRDVLETVRAQEDRGEVRFMDRSTRQEVERQIESHSHLLWSLREKFLDLIRTHEERRFWRLREFLGTAIGHLGVHGTSRLGQVLEILAESKSGGIASTAGYALDHACRHDSKLRSWSLGLLESWILSGHPDRMWAAGSAIWRIHQGHLTEGKRRDEVFLRGLRHRLRVLVQRANVFHPKIRAATWREAKKTRDPLGTFTVRLDQWTTNNANSCVFAVHRMMENDPAATCTMLGDWMKAPPTDAIHQLGKLITLVWLSGVDASDRENQPKPQLRRALLDLSSAIVQADDASLLERLFETLENWLINDLDADPILRALLDLIHGSDVEQLQRLRHAFLRTWIESPAVEVRKYGGNLLRRIQHLLGLPSHSSRALRGVLLYDISRAGLKQDIAPRRALWTVALLEGYAELVPQALGRSEVQNKGHEPLRLADLRPPSPRARLMAPVMECGLLDEIDLLAIVYRGQVLDGRDFDFPEIDSSVGLTVIRRTSHADAAEEPLTWSRSLDELDLPGFCSLLDRLRLQLALKSSASWDAAEASRVDLSERVRPLGDLSTLEAPVDPLGRILGELLAGLEQDLEGFVDVLCEAFDSEEEPLKGRVALATARAFFHIATLRPPPALEDAEALGRLAQAMSRQGWQGGEAVLAAVRVWLRDPRWREALIPEYGLNARLVDWIQPLLPEFLGRFRQTLTSWLEPEDDAVEGHVAEVLPEIPAAVGRLWRRLAHFAGPEAVLSEIEGPYVLILVDRALGDKESAERLDSWLRDLAKGLEERQETYLVYELGRDLPIGIPSADGSSESQLKLSHRGPRLLGPLLEAHHAEEVRGVVLFSAARPVDLSDWQDTAWTNKLKIVPVAPFRPDPFEMTFLPNNDVSPLFEHLIESP